MSKEHIQLLDSKIKQAVELIQQLKMENNVLRKKLGDYESRIQELEEMLGGLKENQQVIEAGLLQAIKELDKLENSSSPQDSSISHTNSYSEKPLAHQTLFASQNEEIVEKPNTLSYLHEEKSKQSSPPHDNPNDSDELKNSDPGLGIF